MIRLAFQSKKRKKSVATCAHARGDNNLTGQQSKI